MLIFANKQDLETALDPSEILETLEIEDLDTRQFTITACSGVEGTGLTEGLKWVVEAIMSKQQQ